MSKKEDKKITAENCKNKTTDCKNRNENRSAVDSKGGTANKKENS
jgi:hypothetical protein